MFGLIVLIEMVRTAEDKEQIGQWWKIPSEQSRHERPIIHNDRLIDTKRKRFVISPAECVLRKNDLGHQFTRRFSFQMLDNTKAGD